MTPASENNRIGTLSESSLHAAIKQQLRRPEDRLEIPVAGYMIDLVRGTTLVEVQTGSFHQIRPKLENLLQEHIVEVVYPITQDKWIVRVSSEGELIRRRKSPKHGQWMDAFAELVYITDWITHPNFRLTLLKIQEEEIWRDDGEGSWRRRYWSIADRRLLEITDTLPLSEPDDYARLLTADLKVPFTTRELSDACGCRIRLAQQAAYTLFHAGMLKRDGRRGRSHLYHLAE
jgi:hypothetical protein